MGGVDRGYENRHLSQPRFNSVWMHYHCENAQATDQARFPCAVVRSKPASSKAIGRDCNRYPSTVRYSPSLIVSVGFMILLAFII